MAYDRFLRFADRAVPPAAQFGELLRAYLANTGAEIAWHERAAHWMVLLPGSCSDTMPVVWRLVGERLGEPPGPERASVYGPSDQRWFEVFVAEHVSVITRHGDDYTSAVADGFARLAARAFSATIEAG